MRDLLLDVAHRSARYRRGLALRSVAPTPEALQRLALLDEPLPEKPTDAYAVLRLLDEIGSPATMATAGGRFFGFVIGSSLPAAVAANWLVTAWDQEGGLEVAAPIGAMLESVCASWLIHLFSLPPGTGVGFVTGATMANFTALAAARHALLQREGWDVEKQGLFGNQVLVSFGSDQVTRRVIAGLQQDETCWCGGTVRRGRAAMRISVSSWATTEEDCERSLAAILRIASESDRSRSL
jgi:hypothetical protein